jgi:hypothetical protein
MALSSTSAALENSTGSKASSSSAAGLSTLAEAQAACFGGDDAGSLRDGSDLGDVSGGGGCLDPFYQNPSSSVASSSPSPSPFSFEACDAIARLVALLATAVADEEQGGEALYSSSVSAGCCWAALKPLLRVAGSQKTVPCWVGSLFALHLERCTTAANNSPSAATTPANTIAAADNGAIGSTSVPVPTGCFQPPGVEVASVLAGMVC